MKPSPVVTLIFGVISGLMCFAFVLVAHRIGYQLSELVSDGLILGGAMSMGVGVVGARFMPTAPAPEQKPPGAP